MSFLVPLLGIASIPVVILFFAFFAAYVFKMDWIESAFGDMDAFWAQRAVWSWTPRRLRRSRESGRRRRKAGARTAKEDAVEARDAAEKAARWPYD